MFGGGKLLFEKMEEIFFCYRRIHWVFESEIKVEIWIKKSQMFLLDYVKLKRGHTTHTHSLTLERLMK